MKFLPNKNSLKSVSKNQKSTDEVKINPQNITNGSPGVVKDSDKRTFLKILGLAGLGILASSAFPKKADALIIGNQSTSGVLGLKDASNNRINPAKEDGNLATIASTVAKESGGHLANVDTNTSTTATNTGTVATNTATAATNTATIATNTTPLTNLQFDTSNNLKVVTSGSSGGGVVQVEDSTQKIINPSTEDSIIYLRRMVRLLETLAAVDSSNRQRISLDTIPAGVTLPTVTTVTTVGTVSTITGGTITTITNPVPIGNVATMSGMDREQYINIAKNAWANGVRPNLQW